MQKVRLVIILVLVAILSACTAPAPVSTSTAVAVAQPTTTAALSTPTAVSPAVGTPTAVATLTTAATTPTMAAAAQTDLQITRGIQNTMNIFARALRTNNQQQLTEVIDQENKPWRRTMNEYMQQWQDSGFGGYNATYTVRGIERRRSDYIMARISSNVLGDMTWIFRYVDGAWKISEPLESELGPNKYKDYGKYRIRYYEWDEPLLPRYEKLMNGVYTSVMDRIKLPVSGTLTISIWPTMDTFPGRSQFSLGGVLANADRDRMNINMRALDTFGAGTWQEGSEPDPDFGQTLEHEFTHIVHGQYIPLARLPNWMSEGLAEYISGNKRPERIRTLIQTKKLFGLQKLQQAFLFDSLRPDTTETTAETVSLVVQGYNESETIVRYMAEQYGLEKFYELNKDYVETRNIDASFQKIFGKGIAQFEQEWYDWLVKSVGS